jgi:ABC-type nitrate/sulfonate/bicarbonate transport system substrate-binding protein
MASPKEASTLISKKRTVAGMVVIGLVIALAGGYFWLRSRPSPPSYVGPVEHLSIGTTDNMVTFLWVAEQNGYFQAQGLDVTISVHDAGLFAFNDLLAGKVQVATCAEFVFATKVLAGTEQVRALGTIAKTQNYRIIARKDRGIAQLEDLAGKNIGVTKNTVGEFLLDHFLTFAGLAREQMHLVDLKPHEMAEALSRGQVDAVSIWGVIRTLLLYAGHYHPVYSGQTRGAHPAVPGPGPGGRVCQTTTDRGQRNNRPSHRQAPGLYRACLVHRGICPEDGPAYLDDHGG